MKKHTAIEALEARIAPATVFAVDTSSFTKLVSFDSAAPGTLLTDATITGLAAGEFITAIDFRPATGELYGLGIQNKGAAFDGRIYKIDPATAVATQVGAAPFNNALNSVGRWGFDFNPTVDRIRITNDFDTSLRVNPDTGALVSMDTNLDSPTGAEEIHAVAYDRNFGGTATTLYGYNYFTDNLVTIGGVDGNPSPNGGEVTNIARATLGGVNFTADAQVGFDIGGGIGGPDVGYFAMRSSGGTITKLYTMNLATAALSDLGAIGDGTRQFEGIAVQLNAPAPTISADGKTATWADLDGDAISLKITKGTLTAANFRMLAGTSAGGALAKLTLADAQYAGTNITITAKPGAAGGDGRVNVGIINATGNDLGSVAIPGDLIAIDAGTDTLPTPSVKTLTVGSMGAFGRGPLTALDDAISSLADGAGKITITGDFHTDLSLGKSKTGSVTIGGDLIGGTSGGRGLLGNSAGASLGKLTIKGSVIATGDQIVAGINVDGVGSVFIGGNVVGGASGRSGFLHFSGNGKTVVALGGSLIGGSGIETGELQVDDVASVKIGGNIVGGSGIASGSIFSMTGIPSIAVKGSIVSNGADLYIQAKRIGTMTVGGDIAGYDGGKVVFLLDETSAPITAAQSVLLGKLTIGGDMKNAVITANGNADSSIGAVRVKGDMVSSSIVAGVLSSNGTYGDADDTLPANSSPIVARIASITIGGQLLGTVGGAPDSFGILAEQIGALTVGKIKIPLTTAKADLTLGFTSDVRVREL